MTDLQLYLAIGLPVIFNAILVTILNSRITDVGTSINKRIDDLRADTMGRFEAADKSRDLKIRRLEELLDARIAHLEDR